MLILASSSPRRRQLLGWLGLPFEISVADIDESPLAAEKPDVYTLRLAQEKAAAVLAKNHYQAGDLILASDTTVAIDEQILGKPLNNAEAERMLRDLCGRTHQVLTAVALARPDQAPLTEVCRVEVPMRDYSEAEMLAYIASGDPLDKAGAYAIQHSGFHPVEHLEGCFAAVMGLPLCHVLRLLQQAGVTLPDVEMAQHCQAKLEYSCQVYRQIYPTGP